MPSGALATGRTALAKARGALLTVGACALLAACAGTPTQRSAAACADVELLDARGAAEAGGTVGGVVGDPFFAAMQRFLTTQRVAPRQLSVEAFSVPVAGEATHDPAVDAATLAGRLTEQARTCPAQTMVLAGYAEGAGVVDRVFGITPTPGAGPALLTTDLQDRISSIAVYANPIGAQGRLLGLELAHFEGRVFEFCEPQDPMCIVGGSDHAGHLAYGVDGKADEGAALVSRLILPAAGASSGPSPSTA